MGYESNIPPKGIFLEQRESFRSHQVKFLSNQIDMCRKYNTIISRKPIISSSLNPWFLTGFSDAESSFSILIQPNVKYKTKWRVKAVFAIGLHKKDIYLLKIIQAYLGVGKITKHSKDSFQLVRGYHSLTTSSILPNRLHSWFITGFWQKNQIKSPRPPQKNYFH